MNREEAIESLWGNKSIRSIDKVDIDSMIRRIYDDFESRTCENCISNKDCMLEEYAIDVLGIEEYGCSEFERKTDE